MNTISLIFQLKNLNAQYMSSICLSKIIVKSKIVTRYKASMIQTRELYVKEKITMHKKKCCNEKQED